MRCADVKLERKRRSDFGKLDHLPGRIPAISNLLEQLFLPLFVAFYPVHDRNVDHSVAAPDLRRNRFSDGATRGDNVVESPDARVVLSNGIRANERSEEHTSELQSLMRISYAVFCLK